MTSKLKCPQCKGELRQVDPPYKINDVEVCANCAVNDAGGKVQAIYKDCRELEEELFRLNPNTDTSTLWKCFGDSRDKLVDEKPSLAIGIAADGRAVFYHWLVNARIAETERVLGQYPTSEEGVENLHRDLVAIKNDLVAAMRLSQPQKRRRFGDLNGSSKDLLERARSHREETERRITARASIAERWSFAHHGANGPEPSEPAAEATEEATTTAES